LRLAVILAVIFVVLGLARGWFSVSKSTDPDDKVNVHFTVDTNKVKEDTGKVKDAAEDFGDKVAGETKKFEHRAAERQEPKTPPVPLDQPQNPPPGNPVPANPSGSVLR